MVRNLQMSIVKTNDDGSIIIAYTSDVMERRKRWAYWSALIFKATVAVAEFDLDSDRQLLSVFEEQRNALKEEYWSL
jgi:hypothetical protein